MVVGALPTSSQVEALGAIGCAFMPESWGTAFRFNEFAVEV